MRRSSAGFTLIEAIVVVAILAIVASVGIPAFSQMLERHRVVASSHRLGHDLALARASALMRRQPVVLCPLGPEDRCQPGTDWSRGWIVFADRDGNGRPDDDADVLWVQRHPAGPRDVPAIVANRRFLRFRHDGTSPGTNLTISVCIHARVATQQIVSNTGRARRFDPPDRLPCPS